jgi:hypothetical protein
MQAAAGFNIVQKKANESPSKRKKRKKITQIGERGSQSCVVQAKQAYELHIVCVPWSPFP